MNKKPPKSDSNTTLKELKDIVEEFCVERNWQNNDPKQLLLSAFIELGELAEHYQWVKDGDWHQEAEKQKAIAYEFVDIFFYLIRFMNKSDLDFSSTFFDKVDKLAQKYPVSLKRSEYQKVKDSYRLSGKNQLYD